MWLWGTVVAFEDNGFVRVRVNGAPEGESVVAPCESGISAVGARVRLLRDSSGRVIQVCAPDVVPDGSSVVPVGATGRVAWEAQQAAYGVKETVEETREKITAAEASISAAEKKAEEARVAVESASVAANYATFKVEEIKSTIDDIGMAVEYVETEVDEAGRHADEARKTAAAVSGKVDTVNQNAEAAKKTAEEAKSAAVTAQNTADEKNTIYRAASAPERDGKTMGDVWWQVDDGVIAGQWVWDGAQWAKSPVGSEVVASLTADKLRAATGSFDTAFMKSLVTDKAFAGELAAGKVLVAKAGDAGTVLIEDGAVTAGKLAANSVQARNIVASQSLTAKVAEFLKLKFSQLESSAFNAWVHIIGAGKMVFGGLRKGTDSEPEFYGARTELSADGLQVYQDGETHPVISLSGSDDDQIKLTTSDGDSVVTGVAMGGRGVVTARDASFDTLTVGGIPIGSTHGSYAIIPLPKVIHPQGYQLVPVARIPLNLSEGDYLLSWSAGFSTQDANAPWFTANDGVGIRLDTSLGSEKYPEGITADGAQFSWETTFNSQSYTQHQVTQVYHVRPGEAGGTVPVTLVPHFHSYKKAKFMMYASVLTISRIDAEVEPEVEYLKMPDDAAPPAPPKPVRRTITVSPAWVDSNRGEGKYASSGSYYTQVRFNAPAVKGKRLISIKVTGRCTWDFIDGGNGHTFPCSLSDGPRGGVFMRDYGTFSTNFGVAAGASLTRGGYTNFTINAGDGTYNEYDPWSFRLHVTYES
jgi:hypothetical protein